jgi:catalase
VTASPPLSLLARPGQEGIKTRKIAILVAPGVEGAVLASIYDRLAAQGAVPRYVGVTLGALDATDDVALEADVTLETAPPVLFDALVLPPGAAGVSMLAGVGHTMEFVKDQYRHCKAILVLGESAQLLEKAGVPRTLPSGEEDSALVVSESAADLDDSFEKFVAAIARHRNFARDADPPLV